MSMTGRRRYRCMDCKQTQFESARTMTRRTRPRCMSCGSTFLEPDSEGAKDQTLQIVTAKKVIDEHNRLTVKASPAERQDVSPQRSY